MIKIRSAAAPLAAAALLLLPSASTTHPAVAATDRAGAATCNVPKDARTFDSRVRMRAGQSLKSKTLHIIPGNHWVAMTEDQPNLRDGKVVASDWIKVVAYGDTGYLHKSVAEGPWLDNRECNTYPDPRPIPKKKLADIKRVIGK